MGIFFVYILKSAICMALFYLFYRILLSKETFHRFNRISLLLILLLSLALPFAAVAVTSQNEMQQTVLTLEQLLMMADKINIVSQAEETTITWAQVVLMTYLAGFLFFIGRNIYSLIGLFALQINARQVKQEEGVTLLVHTKKIAPFGWMNYIFISEKELGGESSREILIHELAHIHNYHSWDLLIAEICACFQWFNPAVWLIKQELQDIHEYEADDTVINQGIDAHQYQLLLIKKAAGTRLYSMANSFNHSKLKKRITMMLKEKSNPWARLKCLYVLPLAAIAITAFARPEVSNEFKDLSAIKVNDLTSAVEAKLVKNAQPEKNVNLQSMEKESSSASATSFARRDTVKTKAQTKVKIEAMPPWSEALIIVDGKEVSYKKMKAIVPEDIASIDVLKGNSATKIYGDRGKKGVILLKLKKTNKDKESSDDDTPIFSEIGNDILEAMDPVYWVDGKKADVTFRIDGKKMTKKRFKKLKLNMDQISSVDVKKHGSEGAVIEITTKSAKASSSSKKDK